MFKGMSLSKFERKLGLTWIGLGLLQTLIFLFLSTCYRLGAPGNEIFVPAVWAWHGIVWVVLLRFRALFTKLDGTPLTDLGWPNILTLFRLSSLPALTVLFLLARDRHDLAWPLVIFITVVFLTDLADGFLARTFNWGSRLGQLIDSSSDYIILMTLTLILGISGVLPTWLLTLVLVRLIFQIVGSLLLFWRAKKPLLETTWLGKASLFALMVLYALEIMVFLRWHGLAGSVFLQGTEITAGFIMVISLFDKARYFSRSLKKPPR